MCNAFSCLVTRNGKVYWKTGVDGHDTLLSTFTKKDEQLRDDQSENIERDFARIEISPDNGNYLKPDGWTFKVDGDTPHWLGDSHERKCWQALEKWKKKVYSQINMKEALDPVHPFRIEPPTITEKHLELLRR